ncbi:EamA family transporter RarD [Microbacterium enclense]|uniref:EamA family transporter RarD n=1 Tax=Microbacterium enclense TaxID=993073 RepID=UPI0021A64B7B|nr:EamA family transporter RarD [Microbacterium enclense]MCT2087002.1 EamA family transporter RarD [Microbacterium enclense]
MTPAPPPVSGAVRGGSFALAAYLLWGVLPLYFLQLEPTGAWELVGWRIALSFVFCLLLLTVLRAWRPFLAIVRQPRLLGLTALAGALIYVNWQTYVYGALNDRVIETSLGYFINPIVTVLLGVTVLRERLRPVQWIAIGLSVAAVLVIVVGYGGFPWIALTLALSFGVYGLVKKQIGPSVDAVSGLTLESFWLLPVAIVQLVVVAVTGGLTMGANGPVHTVLLACAGAITAVPLLLFAAGARRAPLTVMGLIQFVAPIIQFAIGVWVLHEPMTLERWIGFGLVWVALTVLSVDSLVAARRRQTAISDVTEPV